MIEFILVLLLILAISDCIAYWLFTAEIKDIKRALHEAYEARMIREITARVERQAKELFPCDCDKEEENDHNANND